MQAPRETSRLLRDAVVVPVLFLLLAIALVTHAEDACANTDTCASNHRDSESRAWKHLAPCVIVNADNSLSLSLTFQVPPLASTNHRRSRALRNAAFCAQDHARGRASQASAASASRHRVADAALCGPAAGHEAAERRAVAG